MDRVWRELARGDDPLPWAAHATLWQTLEEYADHVRYRKCLGGVAPLLAAHED